MPSFTIEGREYELLTLDDFDDLTLDEVTVLEETAGINMSDFASKDGVSVSAKLLTGLLLISMQRVNPAATKKQAGSIKVSVLNTLMEAVANSEDDADPPTSTPNGSGVLDSTSDSASSLGIWAG